MMVSSNMFNVERFVMGDPGPEKLPCDSRGSCVTDTLIHEKHHRIEEKKKKQ